MMQALGVHWIVDFWGCDFASLNNVPLVEKALVSAAAQSGATILAYKFCQFEPQGVSGAVIISESHFSIHTWPEYGYAAVDLFTCGTKVKMSVALDVIKKSLNPSVPVQVFEVHRGVKVE
jgi:S-adenosylmethionine decarboxylase